MRDVSDIAWPLTWCCDGCFAECTHERHDYLRSDHEPPCTCLECKSFRASQERSKARAVSPEYLGWAARQQGWIDEDGKGS